MDSPRTDWRSRGVLRRIAAYCSLSVEANNSRGQRFPLLVPKLCLGTHRPEALLRPTSPDRERSPPHERLTRSRASRPCVPKQSLGTRRAHIFPLTFLSALPKTICETSGVPTMTASLLLFPTTVVGSMPRPQYVKDLLRACSRTGQHDAGWQRRMDDAVRFVIGMQEQAGIDVISDGEWRRETYVDVVAEIMTGFE